ncbi:MAG: ABC transporter ATP-binding protein/permease [Mesorhizobium sp.]
MSLKRLLGGPQSEPPRTPVSDMRTLRGVLAAYWLSERWKEAWSLTLIITLLTALASKASVWIAVASAELVTSIAFFHDPRTLDPMNTMITSAVTLVALVIMKDAGMIAVRHMFSTTLHRKWRAFLDSRFNAALLDSNHSHFHLQNGMAAGAGVAGRIDNVDQRVQESIKGLTGGAIGLAMGILGVTMSLFFVGMKLLETSTAVAGLDFLGEYGTAVLALVAVAAYVPLNTFIALRIGRVLQGLQTAMQQTEGSYRGELTMFLRRSFQIAASKGESAQHALHDRLYKGIDRTWHRLNRYDAGYMAFTHVYNFFAARIVAYAPGFVPYIQAEISLKNYVTGAELVNQLIGECSWFIQVMPAIASLKANARRVTDLAEAIEEVQTPPDFYGQAGRSAFVYREQEPAFGLAVTDLELAHQGASAEAFLRAPALHFQPGTWTLLVGQSGSGKTSLMKALNRLWPYGSGSVTYPAGASTFFAAQEVKLPRITLKQLICLPDADGDHNDLTVADALHKSGLGAFIANINEETREGQSWDQLLSGGQKQRLLLARIILHKPDILFLDESSSALDQVSRVEFHQAIKDHCPGATVISIMHEKEPLRSVSGEDFYDHVVAIHNGVAEMRPLRVILPVLAAADDTAHVQALAPRIRATPRHEIARFMKPAD